MKRSKHKLYPPKSVFVRYLPNNLVSIPNSRHVSPYHKVKELDPNFIIEDSILPIDKEVSDEEFIQLREKFLMDKSKSLP